MLTVERLHKYQTFLEKNQDKARLFQQPWWLDIVCGVGKWNVTLLMHEGVVKDAIPYSIDKVFGLKILRPPVLTPYLDNVFDEYALDFIQALEDEVSSIIVPFFYDKKIDSPYIKLRPTYTLDLLQDESCILAKYSTMRRRNIKKGNKLYQVKSELPNVPLFVQWHSRSFQNKKIKYPYTITQLQQVIAEATHRKAAYSFSAYDEVGDCVGQIIVFYDTHTAYYLLGAYDDARASSVAMSVLMHEAILYAKGLGLITFDFEGSKDEGIARFFQSFGGDSRHYSVFEKDKAQLWKWKKKWLG